MEINFSQYYKLLQYGRIHDLFVSAIELDIFTLIEKYHSLDEIVNHAHYDKRNCEIFLHTLWANGFIEIRNGLYYNTELNAITLSKTSRNFMGEYFLFLSNKWGLNNTIDLVKNGALFESTGEDKMFANLAVQANKEIDLVRAPLMIDTLSLYFKVSDEIKFIDIGCGSGALSINFVKHFYNAEGELLDRQLVIENIKGRISELGLNGKLNCRVADFRNDDFGCKKYDLIILSGILDFVSDKLEDFFMRIKKSLKNKGKIYLVRHRWDSEKPYLSSNMSTAWLRFRLEGFQAIGENAEIVEALKKCSFNMIFEKKIKNTIPDLYEEVYEISEG